MWLTEDAGRTWRRGNRGLSPRYLPEAPPSDPEDTTALCVHHVERSPSRPERMFMQFHGGVYRSDDAGESWGQIGAGLPSDFGFPLKVDPADPDSAYVIPLVADMDRVMPEGRVRVYETRDGGSTWSPRGEGLPAEHAYLTVLRQAFTSTGAGRSAAALLRRHLWRRIRLRRRGRQLVYGRNAAAARFLGCRLLNEAIHVQAVHSRELLARVDPELQVDVAQVVLDRLGAQEQRRGGLARGPAGGEHQGDLQLLGCQLVDRVGLTAAKRLAGRLELGPCPLGPRLSVECAEDLLRLA